jgi:hypothetical protein
MEPLEVNTVVNYHGSIEEAHGEFVIGHVSDEFLPEDDSACSDDGKRYVIYDSHASWDGHYSSLRQVRRQSITPVLEEVVRPAEAVANPNRVQVD